MHFCFIVARYIVGFYVLAGWLDGLLASLDGEMWLEMAANGSRYGQHIKVMAWKVSRCSAQFTP